MQHPTLQDIRIRSTRDALQVFYGVANRALPLITRRLDAEERRNIAPGNVYVWEERGANTEPTGLGMERWTDGMGWGPSRVRDEFLFYHQKDADVADDLVNPVTPWAQMMRRPAVARIGSRPTFSVDTRANLPEGEKLIKQTYSVHVSLPADKPRGIVRKWHLTAYFSPQKLDELNTIDNIRGVGDIVVPEGWFRSARIGRTRRDSRSGAQPPSGTPSGHPSEASRDYVGPSSGNSYPPRSPEVSHRLPNLASQLAHPSPPHSGYSSPIPGSSSPTSNAEYDTTQLRARNQLVPIEVLVRTSGPRRDPADELLLRKFSSS